MLGQAYSVELSEDIMTAISSLSVGFTKNNFELYFLETLKIVCENI